MTFGLEHALTVGHRTLSVLALSSLFVLFALPQTAQEKTAPAGKQAVVPVKGMACSACARRLQKVLSKLPGVEKAEVQLEKEQAILTVLADSKVSDGQIEKTVRDAGFVPGKVEWRQAGEKKTEPGKSQ